MNPRSILTYHTRNLRQALPVLAFLALTASLDHGVNCQVAGLLAHNRGKRSTMFVTHGPDMLREAGREDRMRNGQIVKEIKNHRGRL